MVRCNFRALCALCALILGVTATQLHEDDFEAFLTRRGLRLGWGSKGATANSGQSQGPAVVGQTPSKTRQFIDNFVYRPALRKALAAYDATDPNAPEEAAAREKFATWHAKHKVQEEKLRLRNAGRTTEAGLLPNENLDPLRQEVLQLMDKGVIQRQDIIDRLAALPKHMADKHTWKKQMLELDQRIIEREKEFLQRS